MSNRITLVRGTTQHYTLTLTDANAPSPGACLAPSILQGALVVFEARTSDMATEVLRFTTAPPALNLQLNNSTAEVTLQFTPADTAALALGLYFYQLTVFAADGTVYPTIDWALLDLTLGGAASPPPPVFEATVQLNHDFPTPNALTYVSPGGTPIEAAQVRVYLKSVYATGNLSQPLGITTTDAYGRWAQPLLVLPGYTYTVRFEKTNAFGPDVTEVVVGLGGGL